MTAARIGWRLLAVGALLLLGISPSWVTWQEFPDKRPGMVMYYIVIAVLLYEGLNHWIESELG